MWADEFNTGLDTSKWNVLNNSNFGGGNNQDECSMAANVTVSGGALRITGKRETVTCGGTNPDTGNNTYYFTSGTVTTRAQGGPMKFKFRQGYIEARMKAPKGNIYWPAFWLVGPGDGSTPGWPDYGEYDISEMYGTRPDATFGTMHYKCEGKTSCMTAANVYNMKTNSAYGGTSNFGTQMNDPTTFANYTGGMTNYNTFGLLWEADRITWYVNGRAVRYFDGNEVRRYESNGTTTLENKVCTSAMGCPSIPFSTVFNYEKSIILNLAMGGNGLAYHTHGYTGRDTPSGYVDGNLVADLPGTLEVDYVRLYQLANTAPPPPPPPTGDTTAPSVSITAPSANQKVSGTVTIAANASDNVGVTKVVAYVDGNQVGEDTSAPYHIAWDTKTVANGARNLQVKAHDAAGNVGNSATVGVQVDNAKPADNGGNPAPSNSTPPPNAPKAPVVTSTTGEKVAVPATDETVVQGNVALDSKLVTDKEVEASVQKVEFYVDGTLVATKTEPPFTFDTTNVADGKRTILQKTYYKDGRIEDLERVVFVNNNPDAHETTTNRLVQIIKYVVIGSIVVIASAVIFLLYTNRMPRLWFRKR